MLCLDHYVNHALPAPLEQSVTKLLDICFPDIFDGRSYYKQEPHRRILAMDGDAVIGQVGLDARVIRVGDAVMRILGIIDLCVQPDRRGTGLGGALLQAAEAAAGNRDFMVLLADDDTLYRKHGFQHIEPASCRWLAIEDRASHGLIERDLSDCFMAKPLTGQAWPEGRIDMLGYLF